MYHSFNNGRISGILSIVPKTKVKFETELSNYAFTTDKHLKLKKIMGFDERRIAADSDCTSDLLIYGLDYLISQGFIKKEEIGALILITQTPDYFMPPTSFVLHGKLGLGNNVLCWDINNGCTGYIYGLLQAFFHLQIHDLGKIVLMTGDTLTKVTCPYDRNVNPMIGDAAAISIIEATQSENPIHIKLENDGARFQYLMIPAGGFRSRPSDETCKIKNFADGNRRCDENLSMNGQGVFTFTQTDVPRLIHTLMESACLPDDAIDYYIFHQPNKFLLQKLATKLRVDEKKMPNNIVEKFGNSSSATIPVNFCHNLALLLKHRRLKICMAGFGVGLSWGGIIMDVGPLDFCEIIEK